MFWIEPLESLFPGQIPEQGLRVLSPHIAFGKDRERHSIIKPAELLDLLIGSRFLSGELIAGEPQDFQPLPPVLAVEFLEFLELGRKAALAGRIHKYQDISLVICQGFLLALASFYHKIIEGHRLAPFSHASF